MGNNQIISILVGLATQHQPTQATATVAEESRGGREMMRDVADAAMFACVYQLI